MRRVLLYMLEAVDGELCLLETLEVLEVTEVTEADALCAALYDGGDALYATLYAGDVGGTGGDGGDGDDAPCAALYAGGRGGRALLLEEPEVMLCMLLCTLEAVEGTLCSLEALEVMFCRVLCVEGGLCLREVSEVLEMHALCATLCTRGCGWWDMFTGDVGGTAGGGGAASDALRATLLAGGAGGEAMCYSVCWRCGGCWRYRTCRMCWRRCAVFYSVCWMLWGVGSVSGFRNFHCGGLLVTVRHPVQKTRVPWTRG